MGKAPSSPLPDADRKLALAFHEVFSTPAGKQVLDYLRASYVHSIMPPEATDQQLRYREGQRSVVGVCDHFIQKARKP